MSDPVSTLLEALHTEPADETGWLALADALEEQSEPDRAELVRLTRLYQQQPAVSDWKRVNKRLQRLLASRVKPCVPERVNNLGMRFALIPAGTFLMGSPEDEVDRWALEGPQHEVEISRPFYMGIFPVTQTQYQAVLGENPSAFCPTGENRSRVARLRTENFPVENVSWEDAAAFCRKLNDREPSPGWAYRLPTEAEWEYSCRGGASSYQVFHFGDSLSSKQANFDGRSPYGGAVEGRDLERPTPVGSYPPNAFGLYDMHGNIREWCTDWFVSGEYADSTRRDPVGPSDGSYRIYRGGCWLEGAKRLRSASRSWIDPEQRTYFLGFRVVLGYQTG